MVSGEIRPGRRGEVKEEDRGTIAPVATLRNTPKLPQDRERIVSAAPVEDDSSFELKLRPQRLVEFIGQPKSKRIWR